MVVNAGTSCTRLETCWYFEGRVLWASKETEGGEYHLRDSDEALPPNGGRRHNLHLHEMVYWAVEQFIAQ